MSVDQPPARGTGPQAPGERGRQAPGDRTAGFERFQALADAIPALIWTAGPDAGCDWFNGVWLAFTGRPLDDELGDGWAAGVHPDDLDRCLATYRDAFDRRAAFEVEYRLRRRDGAYRWLLDRGAPRYEPDGTFAGYTGSCVDVHELKEAEAERRRLLDAERDARLAAEAAAHRLGQLQRISEALGAALTPDAVFDVVMTEALAAAGASGGSVGLVDGDGRRIEVRRTIGYGDEVLDRWPGFDLDDDLPMAEAVRTARPVFIEELVGADTAYETFREVMVAAGRGAVAALPLVVDRRTIGGLGLTYHGGRRFDDDERRFLTSVAQQCAAALERCRLLQAARARQERLEFLADASDVLSSTLARAEVLDRVCRLAVPRLADWSTAQLPEGDVLRRVSLAHVDPELQATLTALVRGVPTPLGGQAAAAVCFRTGQVQVLDLAGAPGALDAVPPAFHLAVERAGITSALIVPIEARGRILGVLGFGLAGGRRHDAADITVAVDLGRRAGAALENATVYERERTIAETLQRSVLPGRLPTVAGVDIAARYRPAGSGVRVGGDWYDAFPLVDGRLGLAVGDVAGHGLRAASTMGQVRNALRAYAVDGSPPGEVLDRLERLLQAEPGAYITAVYAVLDPASGELAWANAGHPGPVLRSAGVGEVLRGPAGRMLGVASPGARREATAKVGAGDVVVLYTDGLVERRGEDLLVGMARLASAVSGAPVAADALADHVLASLLGDQPTGDDVCLLVVGRVG